MKRLLLGLMLVVSAASAQMMRPPAFIGGVPGAAQMQALSTQRHQARTLLYQKALEELRKNPAVAELPECIAPTTGGACLNPVKPDTELNKPAGRRIALLIGNTAYKAPIPSLSTPSADVSRVAQVLHEHFGYEIRVVLNGGKADIVGAINRIAAESSGNDSVLLFYAGHGYLMDDTGMGYWIPVDASVTTAANWISNRDIGKLLKAIPARQVILISDSCFSGSLTREQKVVAGGLDREEVLKRRSVLALSSGDEEPVLDDGKNGHSIFAWNLILTLDQIDGVTPGARVWQTVQGAVARDAMQKPQYGAVVSAGHMEGGEFLFQVR